MPTSSCQAQSRRFDPGHPLSLSSRPHTPPRLQRMAMRTALAALLLFSLASVTRAAVAPSNTPVLRTTAGEPKPTELTVSAADGKAFDILAVQADPSVRVAVRPDPPPPAARHPAPRAHGRPVAAGSSRYVVTITPTPK